MLRLVPRYGVGALGCVLVAGCAAGSAGDVAPTTEDGGVDAGGVVTITTDSGAAPVADSTVPSQTCVHNSDCATGVPNLCQGDNGVACLGGFCVPTGKPMSCDDGIACTDDSCDANTNACVHTPNDAECPSGAYCDPTENCVSSLPCTPGDAVCDRLDVSACDGLWACDATKLVCVQGTAPCQSLPNAETLCDGSADAGAAPIVDGGSVACSWQCNPGFAHLVWTGSAWTQVTTITPPADAGGCECAIAQRSDGGAASDPPDLGFVDSNCDGIDGTVATAVFVDGIGGNAGGAGTMASPLRTIAQGLALAQSSSGAKTAVYVSKGTYAESVSMVNGVSLYGGYDASNKWARSQANVTLIASPTNLGIDAQALSSPFTIQLVSVTADAASGSASNGGGQSAYGIRVVGSVGGATIQACTVTVGSGAAAPTNPPNGTAGTAGTSGGNAVNMTQGSGGPSACGATGGAGGSGVGNITGGNQGTGGTAVSGGGTSGPGGTGGSSGSCSTFSAGGGGDAPLFTPGGGNGSAGPNASSAGSAVGTFDGTGNYLPATGVAGGVGTPGGGGGGGGSGGGTQHGCGFADVDCCESDSGGGGGGGGGGCGGGGGGGGAGGGASIAIVVVGSSVTTSANKLSTGVGGPGGPGGTGGAGGAGGGGGSGGANTNAGDHAAGNGANGQTGGSGGEGGGGSGGPGGMSACFAYSGTSPSSSGDTCANVAGGTGGQGGTNGLSTAASGPTGPTGTVGVP